MNSLDEKTLKDAFEHYYQHRCAKAGAHTPGLEKALLDTLADEARQGKVPLPGGNVVVVRDPMLIEAICAGQTVSVGSEQIRPHERTARTLPRVAEWPMPAKLGLILACFLLPLLVFGAFLLSAGDAGGAEAAAAQPTSVSEGAAPPSGTPTAAPLALEHDRAPTGPHDPASVELAGFSFVLSLGKVQGGTWQPDGAEWLSGTEVRRVIALPWEADSAPVLASLPAGTVVQLRLRSGEVVRYKLVEVTRLARQQIEVLAMHIPSLVIVLHGEPNSDERTVLIAQAMQGEPAPVIQVVPDPAGSRPPIP